MNKPSKQTNPLNPHSQSGQTGYEDILDKTQSNLILRMDIWFSGARIRQIGLPSLYCMIAFLLLSGFALESFAYKRNVHGIILLVFALLTAGCFAYVRLTANQKFANTFIVVLMACLCLILLYTGGAGGTGPLWFFVFPLVAIFIQRLWEGVLSVILLFIFALLLLSFDISADYSRLFIERFLAVYFTVSIMAFLYAYVRTSAQLHMDNLNSIVDPDFQTIN